MKHPSTEQLIDYLHNGLSPEADAATHAHLEACEACRAEYEAQAALSEMLRQYGRATERELPSTVKAAIWQEIRNAQPTVLDRVRTWLRPALALPVAAALAVGLYLGNVRLHGESGAPAIEAAYYLQDHAEMNGTVPFSDRTGASASVLENDETSGTQQTAVTLTPAIATVDAVR